MQHEERLRIWIEQGNVNISQLFFQHYKSLGYQRFGCNAHHAYDSLSIGRNPFSDAIRFFKTDEFDGK